MEEKQLTKKDRPYGKNAYFGWEMATNKPASRGKRTSFPKQAAPTGLPEKESLTSLSKNLCTPADTAHECGSRDWGL